MNDLMKERLSKLGPLGVGEGSLKPLPVLSQREKKAWENELFSIVHCSQFLVLYSNGCINFKRKSLVLSLSKLRGRSALASSKKCTVYRS